MRHDDRSMTRTEHLRREFGTRASLHQEETGKRLRGFGCWADRRCWTRRSVPEFAQFESGVGMGLKWEWD